MPSIVRPRADFISVLEALYQPEPDMTRWAGEFLSALGLLRRGLANAEIARLRERSKNTVANQVATILQKSGAPSRHALAATRLP